jgi:hypothetical protein
MSWFKNRIRDWLTSDDYAESGKAISSSKRRRRECRESELASHGMNFVIYPATGGYVLEYSSYDDKKDETVNRLHVIDSNTDLGEGISHVITFEMLRK